MWRRELIRVILALNWCMAGVSFGQWVWGHNHIFRGTCLRVAYDQMRAEGVEYPSDNEHWPEWYRRSDELRTKLAAADRVGDFGWLLGTIGFTATAVGLMIAFPKPLKPTRTNDTSPGETQGW
jgi:hypothetical protein